MKTIPEDFIVLEPMPVAQGGEKKGGLRCAFATLLVCVALIFGTFLGKKFDASFGMQRRLIEASESFGLRGQELHQRRLQAAPTAAPALAVPANDTNSTGLPSIETEVNITVCGTCAQPVLGPFVQVLTESFTSAGWDAEVTVLTRSPCSQCGAGNEDDVSDIPNLEDLTQETFSFQIVQIPNENATMANSTGTNATAALGAARKLQDTNSTNRIDVAVVLADVDFVNQLLLQVAVLTAQLTGGDLLVIILIIIFTSVSELAPAPAPVGDDQLEISVPTEAPSSAANAVGNRFLQGRRYLQDIGLQMEQDLKEVSQTDPEFLLDEFEGYVDLNFPDDPFECKCVACKEDSQCGGLWYGSVVTTPKKVNRTKIHLVISHCKSDIGWLSKFTSGHIVDSVTVISKCGAEVKGAPEGTDILVLPNLGRCDHTYAYYMAYMLEDKVPEEDRHDSVVFFLKDDISAENLHQDGSWNSFSDMLQIASSERGFACGIQPSYIDAGPNRYFVSAYHEYDTLKEFSMRSYSRNIKGYSLDTASFLSGFKNIDEWARSLPGNPEPQEIVQVCYGGVFAASVQNVLKQYQALWQAITQSLSRGNNIQEGHFAERSWARLLSTPLKPVQVRALTDTADGVYLNEAAMHGPLTRRPKIYIHAGAPETNVVSIEIGLAKDVVVLKADGYQLAVHGHPELGVDIDRLAACMWNGFESKTFSATQLSSAFCPPRLLGNLQGYLSKAMNDRQDVIISNPWLVRDSTADSLGHFLDQKWEVHLIVYYRRYYDWIIAVFQTWRKSNHFEPNTIPMSTIRQIDFIREYCKRLFYGSMIPDDAPYRDFTSPKLSHEKMRVHHATSFHPNLPIQELTDLKEYTYFIAKRYEEVPRFTDNVHIVNYHDKDTTSELYCNVLSHAMNACKTSIRREANPTETEVAKPNKTVINKYHAFVELALGAYMKGKLHAPDVGLSGFHTQVDHWAQVIQSRLENSRHSFDDLPVECLEDFEMQRLLQVSLAYERDLLPEYFGSSKGEAQLRSDFASRTFCSLDVAEVLHHSQWAFLFKQDNNDTLLKAYVHVGGPNTNSIAIQESLIQDQDLLAQDNFFMAVHGATRSSPDDAYVVDNMLYDSDLIGACLWDQEERDHVALSNPGATVCQPGLLPRFRKFVDSAASQHKKLLISNEWLSHMSTEIALDQVLDADTWDVNIVLYYRRYFDWLSSMYLRWRDALSIEAVNQLEGKVQFIDFCRLVNQRLFEAGEIGEHDGPLTSTDAFVDLVDVKEYTYSLWRQFTSVNRFQTGVHILDYHLQENQAAAHDLYCHVLDGAKHVCNDISVKKSVPLTPVSLPSNRNLVAKRNRPSSTIEDLIIGAYYSGAVSAMLSPQQDKSDAWMPMDETIFNYWHVIVQSNMDVNGLVIKDLPMQCLEEFELDLLQDVSLAFEKLLMPHKYKNGGARELIKEFSAFTKQNHFCSLNIAAVMDSEDLVESLFTLNGHEAPPKRELAKEPNDESAASVHSDNDDMLELQFFS